ncbi:MGMT family protein [Paenibacillus sp. TRM 82003]|uniref:MGMT family protein n=1 Tax=Kineococcus sp. TRM81007 TaxID=2925831 RepID=UPI001F56BA76|nr:MGMT family protein [Kineococcus sp. TRM81007]MCI2239198.1 MGMT family protein [Kineococcus sp. TRM81007]MCI3924877.1 MGMT family protein [Paenibacillus sp. TRM 82003]
MGRRDPLALPERAEEVLEVVEAIPAGRVLTYGDVGELVGDRGPRFAGNVLRRFGSHVPWWRVLRADGSAAPPLAPRAVQRWRAEGTPLRRDDADPVRVRVDLDAARWDAASWDVVGWDVAGWDVAGPGGP